MSRTTKKLNLRTPTWEWEYGMGIREWNGMKWNGIEWNGMEWNGMEWNGMEWNGMDTVHQSPNRTIVQVEDQGRDLCRGSSLPVVGDALVFQAQHVKLLCGDSRKPLDTNHVLTVDVGAV
jgi:hypothetical protein